MVWSTISVLDWYSSQFSSVRETSQVDEVSTFDAVSSRSLIGIQYHVTWMTGHVRLVFSPRSFAMKLHRARIENRRTRAVGSSGLHFLLNLVDCFAWFPFSSLCGLTLLREWMAHRANCAVQIVSCGLHGFDFIVWIALRDSSPAFLCVDWSFFWEYRLPPA